MISIVEQLAVKSKILLLNLISIGLHNQSLCALVMEILTTYQINFIETIKVIIKNKW